MAPTPDYHQQQSPLFCLPRELRDQIYELVVYEEDGYHYDFAASTLRLKPPSASSLRHETICLDLAYTCKIASDEMRGVPFRINKITFKAGYSENDGGSYRGVQSRAGRFKCLLRYAQETKICMVLYVAELMTPQVFRDLEARYPSVSHHFGAHLRRAYAAISGPGDVRDAWHLGTFEDDHKDMVLTATFNEALQYILELAHSQHPTRFNELASKAFGLEPPLLARRWSWRQHFVDGSLPALLAWKPKPWEIPSEEELCNLEARLTEPRSQAQYEAWIALQPRGIWHVPFPDIDLHGESQGTKWHFSAAAVAIEFLRHMPTPQLLQLRHIILEEDFKSVSYPASHARGLIPFLKENSNLRIERHIGVFSNLLPLGWLGLDNRRGADGMCSYYTGDMIVCIFSEWIEEAATISMADLPSGAFSLVIEGHTEEGIQAWEILKRAAGLQEAMVESYRRRDASLPPLVTDPEFDFNHYPLPCHLPPSFAQTVRAIIRADSLVQLRGYTGEVWDTEELVRACQHWGLEAWREEWRGNLMYQGYLPTELTGNPRHRYRIIPDSAPSNEPDTETDAA